VDGGIDLGCGLRKSAANRGYAVDGSRALIRKGFTDLHSAMLPEYEVRIADVQLTVR
jgi:hypothetical protein